MKVISEEEPPKTVSNVPKQADPKVSGTDPISEAKGQQQLQENAKAPVQEAQLEEQEAVAGEVSAPVVVEQVKGSSPAEKPQRLETKEEGPREAQVKAIAKKDSHALRP